MKSAIDSRQKTYAVFDSRSMAISPITERSIPRFSIAPRKSLCVRGVANAGADGDTSTAHIGYGSSYPISSSHPKRSIRLSQKSAPPKKDGCAYERSRCISITVDCSESERKSVKVYIPFPYDRSASSAILFRKSCSSFVILSIKFQTRLRHTSVSLLY